MKQVFLFLGLSVLMGTIALFALCSYDEVGTLHAAPVENDTSNYKNTLC